MHNPKVDRQRIKEGNGLVVTNCTLQEVLDRFTMALPGVHIPASRIVLRSKKEEMNWDANDLWSDGISAVTLAFLTTPLSAVEWSIVKGK